MRPILLPLAATLVRAWTRVYTHGLPREERAARQAEIESDLWEFTHDADAPLRRSAGMHVMARLLTGIPDDLAWRFDAGAIAQSAPVRALAAAGAPTGPRRVSALGLAATVHLVAVSAVTWVASVAPAPSPISSNVAPGRAALQRRLASNPSTRNQRARRAPDTHAAVTTPAPSAAAAKLARVFDAVSAAAVSAAVRAGLMTPPHLVAQTAPPPGGTPPQTAPPSPAPSRLVSKLLENRYSLAVRDGQLAGTGAEMLRSAIAQSRFVLLGEDHGNVQTPEFSAAVCNAAGPERFQTMAIEEGPMAAAQLERWARGQDGPAMLAAQEKTNPASVNVYVAREEFAVLQQCSRAAQGEFHLWGLNQEAYGAGTVILSRILESRLGDASREAIQQLAQESDAATRKALKSGSINDFFMMSADDHELARASAALHRDGSAEGRTLFASLVASHEINRNPPAMYDNARRRERLMKTLFAADYARASAAASKPPRVLLKFGAYHIYRGLNPARGSGVGNYVAEFAETEGVQSLHVRVLPVKGAQPIRPLVGQPWRTRPFNYEDDPRSRFLEPILSNRLPSDWTLFDLRPLRNDFNTLGPAANPDLATLVFGIDLLVLVPESTPSTEIR